MAVTSGNDTIIDALRGFFAGENELNVNVGINVDSMIKLGVVAIVTTLVCVAIVKVSK
ncbi:MAG: hypothetical protein ACI3Z9_02010 [Candidatus Onthomorpha sp.]